MHLIFSMKKHTVWQTEVQPRRDADNNSNEKKNAFIFSVCHLKMRKRDKKKYYLRVLDAVPAHNRNKKTCFCRLRRFIFYGRCCCCSFVPFDIELDDESLALQKQNNNNSPVSRFIISTSKLLSFDAMCARAVAYF